MDEKAPLDHGGTNGRYGDEDKTVDGIRAVEHATPTLTPQTTVSDEHLTVFQAVRKWPRISGWAIALSSVIILTGFDINIISSVASLPEFQHVFGERFGAGFILPALWLGLWNAAVPLGAIAGSLAGGAVQDWRGRRLSVAVGSGLAAVGVAAAYASDVAVGADARRGVFLASKTIQGFANGMLLCTAETYLSETLPTPLRGPGLALFPIFTLVGQLIASVIVQTVGLGAAGARSYRLCFAAEWPFTAVPLLVAALMPESPAWLVRVGQTSRARRCFARLDPAGGSEAECDARFREVELAVELEQKRSEFQAVSFGQCLRAIDARRTRIVVLCFLLPVFFGLPLFATASYYVQTLGMDAATSIVFIIIGVVLGLVSNLASFWSLARFGRRRLILVSMGVAAVLWFSIGIAGCFTSPVVKWYTAICMMVTLFTVGIAAWPASYVVGAEASSLCLRARTQGLGGAIANLANGVFNIALPYLYNPDQGNLGGKVGFVFSAFCVLGVFMSWKTIPEMKDRLPSEIDEMFELRLRTRDFKNWKATVPHLGVDEVVTKD